MYNTEIKDKVYSDIDKNFLRYMEEARELVRQPSIASQNIGIEECALMVADHIKRLGLENFYLAQLRRKDKEDYEHSKTT